MLLLIFIILGVSIWSKLETEKAREEAINGEYDLNFTKEEDKRRSKRHRSL